MDWAPDRLNLRPLAGLLRTPLCASPALGPAVEVHVPAEPLSTPVGKTAELTCSYSTSVTDNFALEWSFVQPGEPISAAHPVSRKRVGVGGTSGLWSGRPTEARTPRGPIQDEEQGLECVLGDQNPWIKKNKWTRGLKAS